jgi:hypothetical protein
VPTSCDLDCSDLDEVRRRVVDQVVGCLIQSGEPYRIDLRFGPPPGYRPSYENDDPEVWLVLGVMDEEFAFRVCKATRELWSAEDVANQLYDALSDWLPETCFAWGEQRHGDYVIPPAKAM